MKYTRARATSSVGVMFASRSGNSPATKHVTGSKRMSAPLPVVSAKTGTGGPCGPPAGASAGGVSPTGCCGAPSGNGCWGGSAAGTDSSSTRARATSPEATATRTGACPMVSPAWLSVVTAYWPGGAGASNDPSSLETARTTSPVSSSMNATVTPDSGRPSRETDPWITPLVTDPATSTGGITRSPARSAAATRRIAEAGIGREKSSAPRPPPRKSPVSQHFPYDRRAGRSPRAPVLRPLVSG